MVTEVVCGGGVEVVGCEKCICDMKLINLLMHIGEIIFLFDYSNI